MLRYKDKLKLLDVGITAVAAILSVGIMLYGVAHFGLANAWPELVLNLFYIACLVMMGMYSFNHLKPDIFNYWSSLCLGMTVLLRDVLFPPPLANYALHLICMTLSVVLILMFTCFRDEKGY